MWSAKGYEPITFHGTHVTIHPIKKVAVAKELRTGIPRRLTFHYHPGDFATVENQHYALGSKKQTGAGSWFGLSKVDFGAFVESFPVAQPGVVHARFLGSRQISWDSSAAPSDDFRSFSQVDQTARYHRGQHAQVRFWRAPVTPVADHGDESPRTGFRCTMCVDHGDLRGFLSMTTAAGSRQFGVTDHGAWQLFRGHRRVSRGGFFLAPHASNVKAGQRFQLVATTDGGASVVGAAARVAGGRLAELVRHAVGVDLVALALRFALGEEIPEEDVLPRRAEPVALRYLTAEPGGLPTGRVVRIGALGPVLSAEGVVDAETYLSPGDVVRPLRTAADRYGHVLAAGPTTVEALDNADRASALVVVEVE